MQPQQTILWNAHLKRALMVMMVHKGLKVFKLFKMVQIVWNGSELLKMLKTVKKMLKTVKIIQNCSKVAALSSCSMSHIFFYQSLLLCFPHFSIIQHYRKLDAAVGFKKESRFIMI